jgi:hypothetical protein
MRTSEALIPSLDLVQRTLAVDISYTISRMQVLERIPGNPIGIGYRRIDEMAVALMSRLPSFCRVVGIRPGHEHHIEPVVDWYREHGGRRRYCLQRRGAVFDQPSQHGTRRDARAIRPVTMDPRLMPIKSLDGGCSGRIRLAWRSDFPQDADYRIVSKYAECAPVFPVAVRSPVQVRPAVHGLAQGRRPRDHGRCGRRMAKAQAQQRIVDRSRRSGMNRRDFPGVLAAAVAAAAEGLCAR